MPNAITPEELEFDAERLSTSMFEAALEEVREHVVRAAATIRELTEQLETERDEHEADLNRAAEALKVLRLQLAEVEKRAVPEGWQLEEATTDGYRVGFYQQTGSSEVHYKLWKTGRPPRDLGVFDTWQAAIRAAESEPVDHAKGGPEE